MSDINGVLNAFKLLIFECIKIQICILLSTWFYYGVKKILKK